MLGTSDDARGVVFDFDHLILHPSRALYVEYLFAAFLVALHAGPLVLFADLTDLAEVFEPMLFL